MSESKKVRVAFQPLSHKKIDLADPRELIVDYTKGRGYVKDINSEDSIEIIPTNLTNEMIQERINKIIDNASSNADNLHKLRLLVDPLIHWMYDNKIDDSIVTINIIQEIVDKFEALDDTYKNLIICLTNKMNKVDDRVLSSNDFNDSLIAILDSIEDEANHYIHPITKVCNFKSIQSVNNKTGHVVLTKQDIEGLENVDDNANNYRHPTFKQCRYVFPVTSINDNVGDVLIGKNSLGLNNIKNYALATKEELLEGIREDKYITLSVGMSALIDSIKENNIILPEINGIWSLSSSILSPRSEHGMCGCEHSYFIFGGLGEDSICLNTTEKFDGISWANSQELIVPISRPAASGNNLAALVVGGLDDGDINKASNRVLGFNGTSWSLLDNYITNTFDGVSTGLANSSLYINGTQYNDTFETLHNCHKYENNTWTAVQNTIFKGNARPKSGFTYSTMLIDTSEHAPFARKTETFNGLTWNVSKDTLRSEAGSMFGTANSSIHCGGFNNAIDVNNVVNTVERFNGLSWIMTNNLIQGKNRHNSSGFSFDGLETGGYTNRDNISSKLSQRYSM